ncbi:transposase [uncultured Brachybacterium sp.]|uniref:transposase n=1 Tax=uncultured Brachybacterium sp. TaxID=189680 RepID=UPI0026229E0F|nr:transposase [uncultured Brachybacterium sp.]
MAETAGIERFANEGKYAIFAGRAPIPVSSGETEGGARLIRGGNLQLNCAIHRVAITQARIEGPGKGYYERLREQGKTVLEVLRCMKNQIARRIWRTLTRTPQQRAITNTPIPLEPDSAIRLEQAVRHRRYACPRRRFDCAPPASRMPRPPGRCICWLPYLASQMPFLRGGIRTSHAPNIGAVRPAVCTHA